MVQEVADRRNLNRPRSVVGSSDATSRKFLSLFHLELKLLSRHSWDELVREHVITYVDGQETYALPYDFDRALPDTSYDRANRWKLRPSTHKTEQYYDSTNSASILYPRILVKGIKNNQIYISPTPDSSNAGQTAVFNYISKNVVLPKEWVSGENITANERREYDGNVYTALNTGTVDSTPPTHTSGDVTIGAITWRYREEVYDRFLSNTDVPVLDETLMELAAEYLFLKSSGFEFADAYAQYEEYRKAKINSLTPTQSFTTRCRFYDEEDYGNIPEGSWNIT